MKYGLYDYDTKSLIYVADSVKEAQEDAKNLSLTKYFIQPITGIKTILPDAISTIYEAKVFLKELHKNGESFHPEGRAVELINDSGEQFFTHDEAAQLDKLMDDIYNLNRNCYLRFLD